MLVNNEQLSYDHEIEHLKLLTTKLRRMQFGRKSEKVKRQIEQLELKLEDLEANRAESAPPQAFETSPHTRFITEETAWAAGSSTARDPDA